MATRLINQTRRLFGHHGLPEWPPPTCRRLMRSKAFRVLWSDAPASLRGCEPPRPSFPKKVQVSFCLSLVTSHKRKTRTQTNVTTLSPHGSWVLAIRSWPVHRPIPPSACRFPPLSSFALGVLSWSCPRQKAAPPRHDPTSRRRHQSTAFGWGKS